MLVITLILSAIFIFAVGMQLGQWVAFIQVRETGKRNDIEVQIGLFGYSARVTNLRKKS